MEGKDWQMSPTLVSHNCHGALKPDLTWGHTSRYNTPLVCYACGAIAPKELEKAFREILLLGGNDIQAPLVEPFSAYDGLPGAEERYEATKCQR